MAGVELISAIFHYQYLGKKKREYQANGNQTKKNPTNCLLRITIEKKCCFNLNFCVVMAFFFLFLKLTKKVHITHLLFGFVIDVWVLCFFITLRVESLIGNRQWSRRDERSFDLGDWVRRDVAMRRDITITR